MSVAISPLELFDRLYARFGPQDWWPGETPFEVIVGAVLTQNTAWSNVEKAIRRLKESDALAPAELAGLDLRRLGQLVRSSGYFRQKAKRLRSLVRAMVRDGGSVDAVLRWEAPRLRAWLLEQHGVGPETADSIILYAAGLPSFVIDAYTRRIAGRLPLPVDAAGEYDDLRRYFEENLPMDAALYNEFHALFVRLAVTHCQKVPVCGGCPLSDVCGRRGVTAIATVARKRSGERRTPAAPSKDISQAGRSSRSGTEGSASSSPGARTSSSRRA